MRSLRRRAVGLLAVTAFACGGGDRRTNAPTPVTSPSPAGLAAGSALILVSGLTGAPVAGASVTIAGRTYVADGDGRLVVAEPASPGALIDVTGPSVLDRQTTLRPGPLTSLVLWPRTTPSGIDENFTASIVYTRATREGGPFGAEPLRRLRPDAQSVVVVPSTEILDDPAAHEYHAAAVARITAAARGAVRYSLSRERPATGVVFETRIDPAEGLCVEGTRAFTRWALRGDEITGGQIVFCSLDAARSGTVVHEMGHTFGLLHSEDPRDVMYRAFVRRRSDDFGARESDIMALMLQRRAGNRFPDSDRGVAGSWVREDVIVCR